MTPIDDILQADHVKLNLASRDKTGAVQEVLAQLKNATQVKDFPALELAVKERNAPAIVESGCGICLAHGRTNAVSTLIMAAGRSRDGIVCDELSDPVRLVFVAGIPPAFNAEYLRIVGAIARICRDKRQLDRLLAARTARQFVDILTAGEVGW